MQRRQQKVWDEASAACLDVQTRGTLCISAVALAKTVHYRGAGALEHLYYEATSEFFFIERTTRIQVEYPVPPLYGCLLARLSFMRRPAPQHSRKSASGNHP